MRRYSTFLLLLATAGAAAAADPAGAPKPPGTPLPPRFKQVRERIQALYEHRNQPPPPPAPEDNPFRPPGAPLTAPGEGEADATPAAASERAILEQAVAALRVSGTVEKDGESHLVINNKPYKIGQVVQVTLGHETVYLRVREITRQTVTLALNESETTLNFAAPRGR